MFRGKFEHSIDDKGRLQIPSRFRDKVLEQGGDTVIITALDTCLALYPMDEWVKLETKLSRLEQFDANVRAFQRFIIAQAMECQFDKVGRVLIPMGLRQLINLSKECVIAGQLSRIEIWSQETWNTSVNGIAKNFDHVSQMLAKLGMNL